VFYDHAAGVWVARVSLGVIDGKRVGRKASAKTELGARRALERLQRTYASGAPATETLDEYLGRWLQTLHKQRESTIAVYRHHVRDHIAPLLGGIPIAELRAADVERLIGNRLRARSKRGGRPLSPTTVARIVTTLRIALGRAKLRGELADNVAAQVELPRTPRREVPAMSTGQAEHILDAVRDHWTEPLSRLLLGSGLRLGEAVSLNQGDVYLDEAFVRLRTSKTTIRAVPVSPDGVAGLRQALIAAPRRGADEPLFFGPRTGRRLRGDSVSHALPRILTDAGLARLSPHGLRHGTATLMVAAGVPMRQVADQLGHRNPALTARVYAHVLPEALREAVKVLPNRREA
jgi:integrase